MKSKGKVHVRFADQPNVQKLASMFISCVMLGKFLDLSEFSHLGDVNVNFCKVNHQACK